MHWKSIVTELIWFLKGDTNIKYLNDNGCTIWNADAYKDYLKRIGQNGLTPATKERFIEMVRNGEPSRLNTNNWKIGDLGAIYSKQWRDFNGIDQIQMLIDNIKSNPDSRRLLVSAWNVSELDKMVLPPCHDSFQVYTRELDLNERIELLNRYYPKYAKAVNKNDLNELNIPKRCISLNYRIRSNDALLGKPFNIASYALLLCIIAKEVNMIPDELIASLGDVHLYNNHIEQAKLQLTREPYPLGTLEFSDEFHYLMDTDLSFGEKIKHFEPKMFRIKDYKSHEAIKADISV
jgi:thymidylate synthase